MFPPSTIRFLEGSVLLKEIPPITLCRADSGLLFKEPGGSDQIVNEKAAHINWCSSEESLLRDQFFAFHFAITNTET